MRELKQLQGENARLKKLVAELSLDKVILQKIAIKMAAPGLKRQAVTYIQDHYGLCTQRARGLVKQARNTHYYRSVKDLQAALRQRMREIAQTRIRYGCRRIHVLLRR